MSQVLQLNADYTPMRVVGWEHAIELLLDGRASMVDALPGKYVRSERLALPWPSVIALKRYHVVRGRAKFSGKNVVVRDLGVCSYCGVAPRTSDGRIDRDALTLDHVVPRAQARDGVVFLPWSRKWVNVTSWENATTACKACNSFKADRTPAQANMTLRTYPRNPTQSDVLRMALSKVRRVPADWLAYLPNIDAVTVVGEGLAAPLRLSDAG